MTPNDDSVQTAAPDMSPFAPVGHVPPEPLENPQASEAEAEVADAASPTDTLAALAVAEFEALVDEIAAELEAVWDDEDDAALGAGTGDAAFGGAAETDDASRSDRIRRYARELVAAAYVNRDNSAWDPTDAQSYCSAEADDALLPMLLETIGEADDAEADDTETAETKPADTYLQEDAEEGPEGAFEAQALTHEDGTVDEARAGVDIAAVQPVLMRCHV
jgi:hypothetical protein